MNPYMSTGLGPLIVAVGGGKGGVGKSVVACNLAVSMGRLGARVIVVDADLGAANQHTLFGIDRPGRTVQAFLDKEVAHLEEVVLPTGIPRVCLLPGNGAVVGAANIPHARKLKLIRHIRRLETDVVVVDCGAGVSFNVVDFFTMADVRLVVATPQLTSLQNAYAFIKCAVYRTMRHIAVDEHQRRLLSVSSDGKETERVRDLVARAAGEDLAFAHTLAHCVSTFDTSIVGNQLGDRSQRNVMYALARMIGDFLSVDASVVCTIPSSPHIHSSVTYRRPFASSRPTSPEAAALERLAESILVTDVEALRRRRRTPDPEPSRSAEGAVGLPDSLGKYLRRHDRHRVDWPAVLMTGREAVQARIRNVSLGGASLSAPTTVAVGDPVELRISAVGPSAIPARVRHAEGDRLGVEFVGVHAEAHGRALVERAKGSRAA